MTQSDELCKRLAAGVRRTYIDERTHWQRILDRAAPPYRLHPKWDRAGRDGTIWERLVRKCLARGIEPELFVRATFNRWSVEQPPPLPNQLLSDACFQDYEESDYPNLRRQALAASFRSQKGILYTQLSVMIDMTRPYGWTKSQIARFVLLHTHGAAAELTPLLRYCMARHDGYDTVAERFEELAVRQYAPEARLYREIWGHWIPDDMDEVVARYREAADRDEQAARLEEDDGLFEKEN